MFGRIHSRWALHVRLEEAESSDTAKPRSENGLKRGLKALESASIINGPGKRRVANALGRLEEVCRGRRALVSTGSGGGYIPEEDGPEWSSM